MIKKQKITSITLVPTQNSDNTYSVHYAYIDTDTNKQKATCANFRYKVDALSLIKKLISNK